MEVKTERSYSGNGFGSAEEKTMTTTGSYRNNETNMHVLSKAYSYLNRHLKIRRFSRFLPVRICKTISSHKIDEDMYSFTRQWQHSLVPKEYKAKP